MICQIKISVVTSCCNKSWPFDLQMMFEIILLCKIEFNKSPSINLLFHSTNTTQLWKVIFSISISKIYWYQTPASKKDTIMSYIGGTSKPTKRNTWNITTTDKTPRPRDKNHPKNWKPKSQLYFSILEIIISTKDLITLFKKAWNPLLFYPKLEILYHRMVS